MTEQSLPAPAQTDDLNDWVTGLCMLYCRRDEVRVLWLGPVHVPGAKGQMYGCGQCVAELDYMVHRQLCREDCPKECAAADSSAGRWWRWKR
jgi:hypothetical protein